MTWLSIVLGAVIGVSYNLASYVTYRLAANSSDRHFFRVVLVGVMIRLFVAVMLVVLVLALLSIDVLAFTISFFVVFAAGLTVEVIRLHRRPLAGIDDKEIAGKEK